MTNLPASASLPIESLAACFQNTTTSYKFYWFIAILEHIKKNQTAVIPIDDLKTIMVVNIWYPAVYFHLSFGKQDHLSLAALMLKKTAEEGISTKIEELRKTNPEFARKFGQLNRYVPYLFLEPFFRNTVSGMADQPKMVHIATLAQESFQAPNRPSLYKFQAKKAIEIHPNWYQYIEQHLSILQEFCYWNLLKFLQLRNPNVPNIAGKLFLPKVRNLETARNYWQQALQTLDGCRCIYSQAIVPQRNFSLDHFLPWRYVTHDLLWNIIPTLPAVNSSKSDHLPNLSAYFDHFAHIQFDALQMVASSAHPKAQLDDYLLLFGCEHRSDLLSIPYDAFHTKLYETLAPQFQIARSMGFTGNWSYSPHDLSIAPEP